MKNDYLKPERHDGFINEGKVSLSANEPIEITEAQLRACAFMFEAPATFDNGDGTYQHVLVAKSPERKDWPTHI